MTRNGALSPIKKRLIQGTRRKRARMRRRRILNRQEWMSRTLMKSTMMMGLSAIAKMTTTIVLITLKYSQ